MRNNFLENDMNDILEKRQMQRANAYCKIIIDAQICGYLIDISKTGLRLYIDKDKRIQFHPFEVEICFNSEFDDNAISLLVQCIWVKNKSSKYNEVGCKIIEQPTDKQEIIERLVEFFKRSNYLTVLEDSLEED